MNEHKPEPWEDELVKEFSTKGGYVGTGITKTELITDFIRTLLANQNTANAERIRGLKIVPASIPHGSPYITGVNETAEAAARIVEKSI